MRITEIHVDGFGIWTGLHLAGFSEGVNVLYGPNEVGKSTLLAFLRSMIHGFTQARKEQYLPPKFGGLPGGALGILEDRTSYQLRRFIPDLQRDPDREELEVRNKDGQPQATEFLRQILHDVDEATYSNVFALGLEELQSLAVLRDGDAARYLFSLTTGVDRVSLLEVARELESSRRRLHSEDPSRGVIGMLRADRRRLKQEIKRLTGAAKSYERLLERESQLDQTVARLKRESELDTEHARRLETALLMAPKWAERERLGNQFRAMGKASELPPDALERLEKGNSRLQKVARLTEANDRSLQQLTHEQEQLRLNAPLQRQAMRIEILSEQQEWLSAVENQAQEFAAEIQDLEHQLATEHNSAPDGQELLSPDRIQKLHPLAKTIRTARKQRKVSEQTVAQEKESFEVIDQRFRTALTTHEVSDLGLSLRQAGETVIQLRKRAQLDERLGLLQDHEAELQAHYRELLDNQLLPRRQLAAIGIPFIGGIALTLFGLFMPASVAGANSWQLVVLGLISTAIGVGLKLHTERQSARQLDETRGQLEMITAQAEDIKHARDLQDKELPPDEGTFKERLDRAEHGLRLLEDMLPLENDHRAAFERWQAVQQQWEEASGQEQAARRRWKQALSGLGLPTDWTLSQLARHTNRSAELGELRRRLEARREESLERTRALNALAERIAHLCHEAGLTHIPDRPSHQLQRLRQALTEQQDAIARFNALEERKAGLARERGKLKRIQAACLRQRRELFSLAGTEDEDEFRRRFRTAEESAAARKRYELLDKELRDTLRDGELVAEELRARTPDQIERRWHELQEQLQARETHIQELCKELGAVQHERKLIREDRTLDRKRLELGMVQTRLRQAGERWRLLACTSGVLKNVRRSMEANRQPEALRQAGLYFERLTSGRYTRIWTTFDEDSLFVSDEQGSSIPVERLSRGTREQLFICLRLALVKEYAARGVWLPLILDDVLVNFDTVRSELAARLLQDFAAEGHQVFVFTCHEHVGQMFRELGMHTLRLGGDEPAPSIVRLDFAEPEEPPPPRRRKPGRKKPQEAEPVEEEPLRIAPPRPQYQEREEIPAVLVTAVADDAEPELGTPVEALPQVAQPIAKYAIPLEFPAAPVLVTRPVRARRKQPLVWHRVIPLAGSPVKVVESLRQEWDTATDDDTFDFANGLNGHKG